MNEQPCRPKRLLSQQRFLDEEKILELQHRARLIAEGRRLYVGNLAFATTEEDLKDFFKQYLV